MLRRLVSLCLLICLAFNPIAMAMAETSNHEPCDFLRHLNIAPTNYAEKIVQGKKACFVSEDAVSHIDGYQPSEAADQSRILVFEGQSAAVVSDDMVYAMQEGNEGFFLNAFIFANLWFITNYFWKEVFDSQRRRHKAQVYVVEH